MAYPNHVNANLALITEHMYATMAALVQELKKQVRHTPIEHTKNQLQNQAPSKQLQKLLNCGYMEDEDCLCEDNMDLDFKQEESHQGQLQIRQEDDRVIPEVEDHKELLAKIEVPNSLVNQVCVQSAHGKEIIVVNKVFDKSPEQNGYIVELNPKPPDECDFPHCTSSPCMPMTMMFRAATSVSEIEQGHKEDCLYVATGTIGSAYYESEDSIATEGTTILNPISPTNEAKLVQQAGCSAVANIVIL